MNNNNNKPLKAISKDKNQPETRVFARLISRAQTKQVSGAHGCMTSNNDGKIQQDCHFET